MSKNSTRRQFIGQSTALISGLMIGSSKLLGAPAYIPGLRRSGSFVNGVQIGVISYSYRDMPDQSAEATLKYIKDSGISSIELLGGPAESYAGAPKNPVNFATLFPLMRKRYEKKDMTDAEKKQLEEAEAQMKAYQQEMAKWRVSADLKKFEQFRKMYNDSGVTIYAFKPDAFGMQNTDAEIEYGFKSAKLLGAGHITVEHPSNDAHTLKLGQMAEKHGMLVAYHGHEQETPVLWDTALAQSKANAMNIDLGHYIAAGNTDAVELIGKKHDRIASMHLKDRQTPAHGKQNKPWGQGDTPIGDVLKLMRDQKYKFPATIELEYEIPQGSNAVAEVKKCVEFCKNALG